MVGLLDEVQEVRSRSPPGRRVERACEYVSYPAAS